MYVGKILSEVLRYCQETGKHIFPNLIFTKDYISTISTSLFLHAPYPPVTLKKLWE